MANELDKENLAVLSAINETFSQVSSGLDNIIGEIDSIQKDIKEIPRCNSCQIDLSGKIEKILEHGQPKFAKIVLNKDRIETPEDVSFAMRYCHNCGEEYQLNIKAKIYNYAEQYIISKH